MTAVVADITALVQEFWTLMASNDFESVQSVLSEQFILEWPQSNERIRGATRFAQMNSENPAQGPWRFTVNRIVANTTQEAVSDVTITDGALTARAISFFSVESGKITKIVEYWPEPYAAPANRAHLVEPID
ncbi:MULTISPECIES: nuclear transport factor 2 family protein [Paraburkholderia]|uniref:nuclear transport factor 2 family protein n=1 Tax=Paraburkholderia TaxID=1822464 RepID=UPI0022562FB8|nr:MULTISPECIES: nuclear transport factor 2 family protein [Paraburkholderia]MCX4152958.1 nuclear transport factor 2 family protein [Paraburkholderia aspalathi]MDN7162372.1 nuclear transport factor 2 family protein [Paraburkholderia sp. SECH2]MDQ6390858.1 nuclear transport factor 2 family protein [Paraburkholderia aspalathi]